MVALEWAMLSVPAAILRWAKHLWQEALDDSDDILERPTFKNARYIE